MTDEEFDKLSEIIEWWYQEWKEEFLLSKENHLFGKAKEMLRKKLIFKFGHMLPRNR